MAEILGLKELEKKLAKLGRVAGGKALRSAAMTSTLPLLKEAKETIPVGTVPHKTYKGRLVAPGFGKRSLARKAKLSKDKSFVKVMVGVKPEAFYVIQFFEFGTSTIPANPWLTRAYDKTHKDVEKRFSKRLQKSILKAAK